MSPFSLDWFKFGERYNVSYIASYKINDTTAVDCALFHAALKGDVKGIGEKLDA